MTRGTSNMDAARPRLASRCQVHSAVIHSRDLEHSRAAHQTSQLAHIAIRKATCICLPEPLSEIDHHSSGRGRASAGLCALSKGPGIRAVSSRACEVVRTIGPLDVHTHKTTTDRLSRCR
jgi:hypothetical protein